MTEHTDHTKESYINSSLPASFTSGRNILFLTIAASYGASKGINDLITGVCQTDYSGYPDCRKTTIDSLQTTLSLGLGAGDYRIHTPLMYLDKAETFIAWILVVTLVLVLSKFVFYFIEKPMREKSRLIAFSKLN